MDFGWTYYFNDLWVLPLLCLLFMAAVMMVMMLVCGGMVLRGWRRHRKGIEKTPLCVSEGGRFSQACARVLPAMPKTNEPVLVSVLTCPKCGFAKSESMPSDACQFYYECTNCGVLLRPNAGDCCVFCSFGSVKCPPVQAQRSSCGSPNSTR